jgi:uncharacterized protein
MANTSSRAVILLVAFVLCAPIVASADDQWTWDEVRFGSIVEQGFDNSCGLASLLTIMRSHFGDERYDEQLLFKRFLEDASETALVESMQKGLSLLELQKLAQSIGYETKKASLSMAELEQLVTFVPVLVYLEIGRFRHFAVVRGTAPDLVLLGDPSRGNVEYSRHEFLSEWKTAKEYPEKDGAALIIVRREGVFNQKLLKEPDAYEPKSFIEMWRLLTGSR